MKTRIIKTFASLLAITCATSAYAQNAATTQAASPAAGDSLQEISLDYIVVTAQRRSQRLVDVPISITTATAADLERIGPTSLENLTKAAPGVYLQRNI